jgi:hypothetical protein
VKDGFTCVTAPGDFRFLDENDDPTADPASVAWMEFRCPRSGCYCGQIRAGYPAKPADSPSWQLDGNMEKPTLQPSINCISGCGWNGWLKAGAFED